MRVKKANPTVADLVKELLKLDQSLPVCKHVDADDPNEEVQYYSIEMVGKQESVVYIDDDGYEKTGAIVAIF